MSALQRHQHQVQFRLERGYVTPTGDKAMGAFTCTSVKHPGSTSYSGLVGELFCSCPQACRNVCKHLEAAATSIGFTHAMRLRTAEALVDHLEEDVEEPLNRFGGEAAVKALMEATQTAKSISSAIGEAGALPEGVKEPS
ncbi:hypothetical protein JKP88DRAFT_350789 [Tribonema minus]|uniref:SWIM-type domain-containing protein n=1 Tax=Tribonema minus TaxID=303371 RepID=A0A835YKS2_9STRA|nr:hypothetical protein JKP88DRAFT_350789 [Tribonema minus]